LQILLSYLSEPDLPFFIPGPETESLISGQIMKLYRIMECRMQCFHSQRENSEKKSERVEVGKLAVMDEGKKG
jgi:hypothetical protein